MRLFNRKKTKIKLPKTVFKREKKNKEKKKKVKKNKSIKIRIKGFSLPKFKVNRSMKYQIMAIVLLLTILPVVTIGMINYYFDYKNIENNVKESNIAMAESLAYQVDIFISKSFDILETLSTAVDFNSISEFEASSTMMNIVTNVDQIKVLYIFDNKGKEIASTRNRMDKLDVSNDEWFKKAAKGENAVSDSYIDDSDRIAGVIIAMPMKDRLGRQTGVIAAKIDLFNIANLTKEHKVGKNGISYIIDRSGVVIGHPDFKDKVMGRYNAKENNIEGAINALQNKTEASLYTNDKGQKVIGAYTVVPTTGWGVIVEQPESEVREITSESLNRILIITGVAIIISIFFSIITARLFTKPITKLAKTAEKIKDGDLTEDIAVTSKNEIGELQRAFKQMVNSLFDIILSVNEAVHKIKEATEELNQNGDLTVKASEEISDIIEQVAAGTEEQLASVDNTTDNVKRMVESVKKVEESAEHILQATNQASAIANAGSKDIHETKNAMDSIADKVRTSAHELNRLVEHTKEISKIVTFIDNISKQTNLLALNAAIEAARAGEYGKGFTVVAEEVRVLAEQTSNASKDIVNIINQIQQEMEQVTVSMEAGIKEVDRGNHVILNTTKSFENIIDETNKVVMVVKNFTSVINELSNGMEEIEKAILQVSSVSQQIASGTQTVLASTEEQQTAIINMHESTKNLDQMADVLKAIIQGFKVE
jgi:methyl-accepting chemotaxis protein